MKKHDPKALVSFTKKLEHTFNLREISDTTWTSSGSTDAQIFMMLLQCIYGLLSFGGTVIICKMQGDSADDIISKGWIPSTDKLNKVSEDVQNYTENMMTKLCEKIPVGKVKTN